MLIFQTIRGAPIGESERTKAACAACASSTAQVWKIGWPVSRWTRWSACSHWVK